MMTELCTTNGSSTECTTTYATSSPQYIGAYGVAYLTYLFDFVIIILVAKKTIAFLR